MKELKSLNVKQQLDELIKLYKEETNNYDDDFSHGDGVTRVEAYKRVIEDLKTIINGKLEEGKIYKIISTDSTTPIIGKVKEVLDDEIVIDISEKYNSNIYKLHKDRIYSFIEC